MHVQIQIIPVDPTQPLAIPAAPGPPPETLWHYTTGQKLELILKTGEIRPSTARLDPDEKPVVWFSSRPTWEPTATKCPLSGKLGQIITAEAQAGLVRVAVSPEIAPYAFQALPLIAGTSPRTCIGLILAGLELGADPNQWRFTPKPVPVALFRSIERYEFASDTWAQVSLSELAGCN